jgi:hypothetical protein
VEKVARAAADPELRDVASSAMSILEKVAKEGEEASAQPESAKAEAAVSGIFSNSYTFSFPGGGGNLCGGALSNH